MRLSVIGCSGSGKTTLAREAARRLGAPFIELDAIRHQANWVELPDDQLRPRVAEAIAGDAWVCDGDYSAVYPMILERSTDVAWLDPPKSVVMAQVIWRSFSRAITARELWNGNRESFANWSDRGHPIRWAWTKFEGVRAKYARKTASGEFAHVAVHHLRDRHGARAFLARLGCVGNIGEAER
jgi:adenylate kinase family enzyme